MRTLIRFLIIVLLLVVVAALAYLATTDIPAPVAPVEKTIPSERFAR